MSKPRTCQRVANAAVCAALACSCAVENRSAFDDERFLCAAELAHEWQAEQERCRTAFDVDRSCPGVVSFAGDLQGSPVVVDTELTGSEFKDQLRADSTLRRTQTLIQGESPYFVFSLRFTSVGGALLEDSPLRELAISRVPTSEPALALDDALAHAALGLSASNQSVEAPARAGSLLITKQATVEQSGSFDLEFEDGAIEGCFHVFTTTRVVVQEEDGQ